MRTLLKLTDVSETGNMRSDKSVRLAVSQDKFIWAAKTRNEFEAAINNLSQVNAAAAQYLTEIPVEKWVFYPYYDNTPLHGWRTTNFVESEQAKSLLLKPRLMLPFEFFSRLI